MIAASSAHSQFLSTTTDRLAWGENIGWVNFAPVTLTLVDRPVFFDTYASGFAWAENVGWFNLGDGSPADGMQYANTDNTDFGVNVEPDHSLTGFAWGENIGWINFRPFTDLINANQHARIDLAEGRLRGYAWAENVGWINFDSNEPTKFVRLRCLADVNEDGIVSPADFVAWISAFNLGATECDQNFDGLCTTADFTAWIANFNAGCQLN